MTRIEQEIKQKKFNTAGQKAVVNLIFTANWLQTRQREHFRRFGITGRQFNILRILKGQYPDSISATAIKARMLDRNSDISRLLDRLSRKALISKRTCPADKRACDVRISEAGLELLKQIDRGRKHDAILALSDEEARTLSDLLDKARGG